MTPTVSIVLRGAILLTLLIICSVGLTRGVLAERQDHAAQQGSSGQDPGLRILLHNRTADRPAHEQLDVYVLQDAIIYAPSDTAGLWVKIPAGTQFTVLPNIQDGLIITARSLPRELAWPVNRIRMIPVAMAYPKGIQLPNGDDPEMLRRLDRPDLEARDRGAVFKLRSRSYRGCLDIHWGGPKDLFAVNNLPVEAYLEGVLQAEMAASWPLEALKAQAVASRGYAYARLLSDNERIAGVDFDVHDSVKDQEYRGTGNGGPTITWAVNDTRGQILTNNGVPFLPFFHASSGGRTANVDEVFPGSTSTDGQFALNTIMISKEDPYCLPGVQGLGWKNSHWEHQIVVKSGDLRALLRANDAAVGWIQDLTITRSASQRTNTVSMRWFGGDTTMSGNAFRMLVGPMKLRSTLWTDTSPEKKDNTFTITTRGWGHGVGMSQVSAYAMAKDHRWDHRRILAWFYNNAGIERIWN